MDGRRKYLNLRALVEWLAGMMILGCCAVYGKGKDYEKERSGRKKSNSKLLRMGESCLELSEQTS